MSPETFGIVTLFAGCALLGVLAHSWPMVVATQYLGLVCLMALRKEEIKR